MAELRFNPLLRTWTIVSPSRQASPAVPRSSCPFCPGSGLVPDQYDVFKYDNDFPALSQNPPAPDPAGSAFYRTSPAYGSCEVILYTSDHEKSLHELPVPHIRKLVDLWAERCEALSSIPGNKFVMPFENRGEENGVMMDHPHGQIYAYSWIPQKVQAELDSARAHYRAHGDCLICRMNTEEKTFKRRIIFENESFYAYIPFFTDYPFGVFISAKGHRNYITDFSDNERNDLAQILKIVTGSFDKLFDRPFPYMMIMHQNPVNSPEFEDTKDYYHFHIEFYTPLQGKNKIKHNASSESGAWAAINVASVETTAAELRCAKLAYLADFDADLLKVSLVAEFIARYAGDPSDVSVFASPARINIIGEHIDYNGGKVFPAAIDKYLYLMIRKRADSKIVYNDLRFAGEYTFSVNDTFAYKKENGYTNYLNGILKIMADKGFKCGTGFEILMYSTIPDGGGVSSSAALEVGFAYAVSELFGFGIDRVQIALMGQQSEHEFMNVKCGIMDQFIIATGKKDNAIMLDTNTLDYRYVPLALSDYRIVVMNTNKKRQLADSKYNERREECMTGLAILQKHVKIDSLCELNGKDYEALSWAIADPVIQKRVRHCVYENDRVLESVAALEKGDLKRLGSLLCQSHVSLRDDYEVTGLELDTLYEEASKADGCLGARMTGAGFGGCAIAIVHRDSVKAFTAFVKKAYAEKTGLEATLFSCKSGNGVFKF